MSEFAGVFRSASLEPVYTQERLHVIELMNAAQSEHVSVAECRVAPGVTTQLHRLRVAERYIMQRGQGVVELDRGEPFAVGPGDCVAIPAGCPQRIKNVGSDELIFLCVCTPRFEADHYEALEHDDLEAIEA